MVSGHVPRQLRAFCSMTMHSAPSGTGASTQPHRMCWPEGAAWNIRSKALVLPTRRRRPESPWDVLHLTLHLSPRSELSRLFPIGARRGQLPSALALEILLLVNALPRQEKTTGPWKQGSHEISSLPRVVSSQLKWESRLCACHQTQVHVSNAQCGQTK